MLKVKWPAKAPAIQAIQMYPLKSIKIIMIKRLKALERANMRDRVNFCWKLRFPDFSLVSRGNREALLM